MPRSHERETHGTAFKHFDENAAPVAKPVAIDDQDETIEIQYFDGTVTEIEFDSLNEQLLDEAIDVADAPEDWSGAVDVEAEYLDRDFEDNARPAWARTQDRSLRR